MLNLGLISQRILEVGHLVPIITHPFMKKMFLSFSNICSNFFRHVFSDSAKNVPDDTIRQRVYVIVSTFVS